MQLVPTSFLRLEGSPFSLVKRDALLGGSVAQRAATACVPLLAGIQYGWSLVCEEPLALVRSWRGWNIKHAAFWESYEQHLAQSAPHTSSAPPNRAQRAVELTSSRGEARLSLRTGIWLLPSPDHALRLTTTTYHRHRGYDVERKIFGDRTYQELVLSLRLSSDARHITLAGEVATIGPIATHVPWRAASADRARALVLAHQAFFDADYFREKGSGPTRKYKRAGLEQRRAGFVPRAAEREALQIEYFASQGAEEEVMPREFATASGPVYIAEIRNALPFSAAFDGMRVQLTYDSGALEARAKAIRAAWANLGSAVIDRLQQHQGAFWYFTKYFTPHADGEANFFVKPSVLADAPAGHMLVVDGVCGADFDVLRGVISTDLVSAMPCVFALHGPEIAVARGQVLAEAFVASTESLSEGLSLREVTSDELTQMDELAQGVG